MKLGKNTNLRNESPESKHMVERVTNGLNQAPKKKKEKEYHAY